jgi:mannose-6-phosphate isomerase-like protein (cupin superfamily)
VSQDVLVVGGDEVVVRVPAAATGGRVAAVEVRMAAGGGPPGLHRHAACEVYRVEEGELAFYVEDDAGEVRRTVAPAGSVVPIAGGREHTIRNESAAAARAYVVYSPGDGMEGFARAAAALAAAGRPSMADVVALAGTHGIEMTRPLAAAGHGG